MVHKLKPEVTRDEKFARLVWARILKGNAEGADEGQSLPPNIDGFIGARKMGPIGQEYVDPDTLRYVEASQLTYTITRPDVYNAIMAIPGYSHELERELGVDKSKGMNSWPSVPSLRLRALRPERHAEPSCRRHTRAAPRRDEGHHRRQGRVRRPLSSVSWRLSQRTFSRSATISCEPSSVPPRRVLATSIAVRPMSSSASALAP